MKGKNVVIVTTIVTLLCVSTGLSQTKTQPKPKVTPQPSFINNKLEDIDKRLTIVEGKQETISSGIGSTVSLIGIYTAITGVLLTGLAGGSIAIIAFRRFVLRDLYESVRKDFDKEIKKIKNDFDIEVSAFKDEVKRKIDDSQQLVNLVKNYLEFGGDDEEAKSLKKRIKQEPDPAQENIFICAVGFQREIFRRNNDFKEAIERLIPIYEGIIESEEEGNEGYFRSRANLSYIYNYKKNPNIFHAKHLIDEAIRIRDLNKKIANELYFYEFMRAIYLMKMHSGAVQNPEIVSQISDDLQVSSSLFYTVQSLVKDIVKSPGFDQQNHRRYIIKSEFDLIKMWLDEHPEVTNSLSFINKE